MQIWFQGWLIKSTLSKNTNTEYNFKDDQINVKLQVSIRQCRGAFAFLLTELTVTELNLITFLLASHISIVLRSLNKIC